MVTADPVQESARFLAEGDIAVVPLAVPLSFNTQTSSNVAAVEIRVWWLHHDGWYVATNQTASAFSNIRLWS